MTCREFIEFLAAYIDRELSDAEMERFDAHLSECRSCVAYLKTYQESIRLMKKVLRDPEGDVPEEVPAELVKAILASRRRIH